MDIRVRKSTLDLTPQEIDRLVRAIIALKDKSDDTGETGYNHFIKLHAQAVAKTDKDATQNAAHICPAFLPWHREFIYQFETALRDLGGEFSEVTLPYWDWMSDPEGESVFTLSFMGTFTGDIVVRDGPFGLNAPHKWNCKQWTVSPQDPTKGNFGDPGVLIRNEELGPMPSLDTAIGVMKNYPIYDTYPWGRTSTDGFRHQMELPLHQAVHGAVGGMMANPDLAVNDPVFFLHHANVDRMWASWQAANPSAQYVPDTNVNGLPGQGIDEELYVLGGATPRSVWNLEKIGVQYFRRAKSAYTIYGTSEFGGPWQTTANPAEVPIDIGQPPDEADQMATLLRGFSLDFWDKDDHQVTSLAAAVLPPDQYQPSSLAMTSTVMQSKGEQIEYQRDVGFDVIYLSAAPDSMPPIGQGYMVAGSSIQNSPAIQGTGDLSFNYLLKAPANATSVLAGLTAFTMAFTDTDHNLDKIKVYIDGLGGGLPNIVNGNICLKDKSDKRVYLASVKTQFLFLAPILSNPKEVSSTVDPGMYVAQVWCKTFSFSAAKGGTQHWTIPNVKKYGPKGACQVLVFLTGFQLDFPNANHKVESLEIIIDSPETPLPEQITGMALFKDKSSDRAFSGTVSVCLVYLTPYWI